MSYRSLIKQERSDKFWNFIYKAEICFMVGLGVTTGFNYLESNMRTNSFDKSFFQTNTLGMKLKAPKGTIDVVIDQNFTPEQKQYIKESIEEMDFDLTAGQYNVILDNTQPSKKCVKICRLCS